MKNISSIVEEPIAQLKESLKSSIERVSSMSEETFSKWKIGRRNFP